MKLFPLPPPKEEAMTLEEWDQYHSYNAKYYPFRHFLHWTLPITLGRWRYRYFTQTYWWVTHRLCPRHRYHVMRTGLKPGYYDPDTRILHGVMEEVKAYVEAAKDRIDWDYDEDYRIVWKTFTNAVEFWEEYKKHEYVDYYDDAEWEQRATDHLIAVLRFRGHLWY